MYGAGDHQPTVMRGHRERFGNLAVAALGDPVHGAGHQAGAFGCEGLDACFLCHTLQDDTAAASVTDRDQCDPKNSPRIR